MTALSNAGADFVHQNVVPRTSHEGIQFDKAGNMYFIDELNGGNLYKYTPAAKFAHVIGGQADYFAAGQTFVLRVGDGNTPNATGAFTWVPFTDANGAALPGAITITDVNGVTSVDARNTTNLRGVQRHRLSAARRHADADAERPRVPLRHDDDHERGLPARSEEQDDLGVREQSARSTWRRACRSARR